MLTIKKQPRRTGQTQQGPKTGQAGPTGPLTAGPGLTQPTRQQGPQTQAGDANVQQPTAAVDPAQDPDYIARHAILGRTLTNTNTALGQDAAQIENVYGFGADTSNPFSRQALLRQAFQNQQRGTTNNLAARGQLYSGAYSNQQGIDTRNNDIGVDAAKRAYQDALTDVGRRKTNAQTAYESGDLGALQAARDRAINNPPPADTLPPKDLSSTPLMAGVPLTAAQKRRRARLAAGINLKGGINSADARDLRARGLLPG